MSVFKIISGGFRIIKPIFSGWFAVPSDYRTKTAPEGKIIGVETISLKYENYSQVEFKKCVSVYLSSTHLYLEYIGMMNWIYPKLKLPLAEMKIYKAPSMWADAIEVSLPRAGCPTFYFENPISDKLYFNQLQNLPEFG